MGDRWARIQLAQLRMNEITTLEAPAAAAAGDLERLKALRAEVEVIYASVAEIRREQLMEEIEPPRVKRRGWFARLFAGSREGERHG